MLGEEVRFLPDVKVWGGSERGSKALWGNRVLCDEELVGETEGLRRKEARGCEHCKRGRGL